MQHSLKSNVKPFYMKEQDTCRCRIPFDHSNATVAKLLNTPVIIVSTGGIGKAIDEIMLNVAVFQQIEIPIMGVIINKVFPEKYEKINSNCKKGLQRLVWMFLGVIPLNEQLTYNSTISIHP